MPLTIDASVIVSAASPKEHSEKVSRAFLHRVFAVQPTLYQPVLTMIEVAAALARRDEGRAHARAVGASFAGIPFVEWVPLEYDFVDTVIEIAINGRLRASDAVYVAVALTKKCDFVSLDSEHLRLDLPGIRVFSPAQAIDLLSISPTA